MDTKDDVIEYLQSENQNLASDLEWCEAMKGRLESQLANYNALLAMSEADHQKTVAELRELLDVRSDLISKYARLVDILLALVQQNDPPPRYGLPSRVGPPRGFGALLSEKFRHQGLASHGYINVRRVDPDDD